MEVDLSDASSRTRRALLADSAVTALGQLIVKARGLACLLVIGSVHGWTGVGSWAELISLASLFGILLGCNSHVHLIRWTCRARQCRKDAAFGAFMRLGGRLAAAAALAAWLAILASRLDLLGGSLVHVLSALAVGWTSTLRQWQTGFWRATGELTRRLRFDLGVVILEVGIIALACSLTNSSAEIALAAGTAANVAVLSSARRAVRSRVRYSTRRDARFLWLGLRYGAPLTIGSVGQWFATGSDRMVAAAVAGYEAAGLYAACAAAASLVASVVGSVAAAAFPLLARRTDSQGATSQRESLLAFATLASGYGGLAVSALITSGAAMLERFARHVDGNAALIAGLLGVASTLNALAGLWGQLRIARGDAWTFAKMTLFAGAVGPLCSLLLATSFGLSGVAMGCLIAGGTLLSMNVRRAPFEALRDGRRRVVALSLAAVLAVTIPSLGASSPLSVSVASAAVGLLLVHLSWRAWTARPDNADYERSRSGARMPS